jgi:thymidylate synthase
MLGKPFNVASYAALFYILAKRCGMKPKELVYSGNDVHIYQNHYDAVKTQLSRTPRPLPRLDISDSVKNKDWFDIDINDFDLVGYFPYPGIKAKMAI